MTEANNVKLQNSSAFGSCINAADNDGLVEKLMTASNEGKSIDAAVTEIPQLANMSAFAIPGADSPAMSMQFYSSEHDMKRLGEITDLLKQPTGFMSKSFDSQSYYSQRGMGIAVQNTGKGKADSMVFVFTHAKDEYEIVLQAPSRFMPVMAFIVANTDNEKVVSFIRRVMNATTVSGLLGEVSKLNWVTRKSTAKPVEA